MSAFHPKRSYGSRSTGTPVHRNYLFDVAGGVAFACLVARLLPLPGSGA